MHPPKPACAAHAAIQVAHDLSRFNISRDYEYNNLTERERRRAGGRILSHVDAILNTRACHAEPAAELATFSLKLKPMELVYFHRWVGACK